MMEFSVASRPAVSISPSVDDSENSNPQQGPIGATPIEKAFRTDVAPEQLAYSSSEKSHVFPVNRRSGRPSMKIPATTKDNRKLFVGGLPMDVTSSEFLTFFAQFGQVLDSVVMFDRETRKPRGFGFITYSDPDVCRRLLAMGQMATLEEDKESDGAPHGSGRLEMRGKLIEVKAAQPKASAPVTKVPLYSAAPMSHYPQSQHPPAQHYDSPSSGKGSTTPDYEPEQQYVNNSYEFGAKHPATLPPYQQQQQQQHHAKFPSTLYGFNAPPTPRAQYGVDPTTPVTPQAALDMAHHMMFYSQLLATPTLISPLMSPMMSPMILGYDPHYSQQFSQHFSPYKPSQAAHPHYAQHYAPPPASYYAPGNTKTAPPPPPPDVSSKAPLSGTAFRIGGATFVLEEPQSPTGEREELSIKMSL